MTDFELAQLIIRRYKEQNPRSDWKRLLNIEDIRVIHIFNWENTPEKSIFWSKIDRKIGHNLCSFLCKNLHNETFINLNFFI